LIYSPSAFGYSGRSIFSRSLYPLQSYLQSLITDNLVLIKSGVLVAKVSGSGAPADQIQRQSMLQKLNFLKKARTGNTLQVNPNEEIESLDLHNIDYQAVRANCLQNVALSLDMPTSFLTVRQYLMGSLKDQKTRKL